MVNDKDARDLRVDERGIRAAVGGCIAHRGEVDENGHTGEVLEEHAPRHEFDLLARAAIPASFDDAAGEHVRFIGRPRTAQYVFEKDLQTHGQRFASRTSETSK